MNKKRLAKISNAMEIPLEIITGLPKISLTGNCELYLENHCGIIQYTSERVRARTKIGEITVCGKELILTGLTTCTLTISGEICSIGYKKAGTAL